MKVILDTNVYLSYLGAPETARTITRVVRACLEHPEIELIVPPELITELRRAAGKRHWRKRVTQSALEEFVHQLRLLAEMPPQIEEIPVFTRDRQDDYLLAYALLNEADYLVTGDWDLLELGSAVGSIQIVLPADFLSRLP